MRTRLPRQDVKTLPASRRDMLSGMDTPTRSDIGCDAYRLHRIRGDRYRMTPLQMAHCRPVVRCACHLFEAISRGITLSRLGSAAVAWPDAHLTELLEIQYLTWLLKTSTYRVIM